MIVQLPPDTHGMRDPILVKSFSEEHRAAWEVLARDYKDFYQTPTADQEFDEAWHRLMHDDSIHGLGAFIGEQLVGIAHYIFESTTWAQSNCYLQDLFTSPEMRGKGVARALIEAVAQEARSNDCNRYYWQTKQDNTLARALYDKVGYFSGFIRYNYDL